MREVSAVLVQRHDGDDVGQSGIVFLDCFQRSLLLWGDSGALEEREKAIVDLTAKHAFAHRFHREKGDVAKKNCGKSNQQQPNQRAGRGSPLGKRPKRGCSDEWVQVPTLRAANDREIKVPRAFNWGPDQVVAAVLAGTMSFQYEFGWFRGDG